MKVTVQLSLLPCESDDLPDLFGVTLVDQKNEFGSLYVRLLVVCLIRIFSLIELRDFKKFPFIYFFFLNRGTIVDRTISTKHVGSSPKVRRRPSTSGAVDRKRKIPIRLGKILEYT